MVRFFFDILTEVSVTEGDVAAVNVLRNNIRPSYPVTITVTTRPVLDKSELGAGEYLADDTGTYSSTNLHEYNYKMSTNIE